MYIYICMYIYTLTHTNTYTHARTHYRWQRSRPLFIPLIHIIQKSFIFQWPTHLRTTLIAHTKSESTRARAQESKRAREQESERARERESQRECQSERTRMTVWEREWERDRDREHIVGTSMKRHEERESENKRVKERESERAREREGERARERERAKEWERERENLSSVICGHVRKRERARTHHRPFVDTTWQRVREWEGMRARERKNL